MALTRKNLIRYTVLALTVIALWSGLSSFIYGLQNANFWTKNPSKEALQSLTLTDAQCKAMFPDLTKEIDDAAARGPFDLKKQKDDYAGLVQGRIRDGKLYIISVERGPSRDMLYVSFASAPPNPSKELNFPTGAKFCPPCTAPSHHYISRTHSRHHIHIYYPRHSDPGCLVFLPLE